MKSLRKIITLSILTLLANQANAASFKGNDINLVNTANVLSNGDLQLTAGSGGHGAAWLVLPLSTTNSFTANFSFSIERMDYMPLADGLAFVLQNNGDNVIGDSGGGIGYNGLNGIGSIIQTWIHNRAGLNTSGYDLDTMAAPVNMVNSALITGNESITYNALTHQMNMTGTLNVDGTLYNIIDVVSIDLSAKFGSSMYVGFTGSTGGSYSDQRITDFTISAIPEPETYVMFLAGLGLLGFLARRRKESAFKTCN